MRKCKEKYLQINFEPVVKKSHTIREILDNLGIMCAGGSYQTIKKYINLYNLDTSHFYTQKELYEKRFGKYNKEQHTQSLKSILVENSTYRNTSHLKHKLYKIGLKQKACELCGQDEHWQGKQMSLILDHINGNPTDNRFENLQILCPNCNATTETFSRGHKKLRSMKKNYYCKCGVIKSKKANTCKKCVDKTNLRKMKHRPNYSLLCKQVVELGYVATGKLYDVSDNTIRNWMKSASKLDT